ncbi:Trm112 family protein [Salsipaludibacter albus]|uniref:Trm112 family protein n=1 Tax=Salsipaludibacter albus TaxID=2849650 RepID=UPI001EE4049D|nr:Trm112 family protein [Salsipaludibacter albus]MBY5163850.1 Trm112 family protein [Salsipaludibacter albus]
MPYVDEVLLEVLVCPDCRGHIEYKDRRKVVVCEDCGLQYPVVDGIPVMLVEQAKPSRRR